MSMFVECLRLSSPHETKVKEPLIYAAFVGLSNLKSSANIAGGVFCFDESIVF